MDQRDIISDIEHFSRQHGMKPSVICRLAIGNAKLYDRMVAGGGCNIRTAHRLRMWMRDWRPSQAKHPEGA